jgi:hypothetical protein
MAAHVGIAEAHPLNAPIIAYLTRQISEDERRAAIVSLERSLAKSTSPILAKALQKLRDQTPDPPLVPSQSPDGVDMMSLGALPDIVQRLWKLGRALPTDCRWVAFRRAVLAHSETGVIFGLAVGTFGIALRLPDRLAETAEAGGATRTLPYRSGLVKKSISALEFGPDWWFCDRSPGFETFARAAYSHFGALNVAPRYDGSTPPP